MHSTRVAVLLLYITFACALAVEKRGFEDGDSKSSSTPSLSSASPESNSDASTGPVTPPPPGSQTAETYHNQMMGFHGAFVPADYQGKIRNELPSTLPQSFALKLPQKAQDQLRKVRGSRTRKVLTGRRKPKRSK